MGEGCLGTSSAALGEERGSIVRDVCRVGVGACQMHDTDERLQER